MELDLRVRNGASVATLAIESYVLNLPSGLLLNLDDCYYVPCNAPSQESVQYMIL